MRERERDSSFDVEKYRLLKQKPEEKEDSDAEEL